MIEEHNKLTPVEIKSGQTVSQDFFKGLIRWQKIAGVESSKGIVLYAGKQSYERQEGHVIAWKDLLQVEKIRAKNR